MRNFFRGFLDRYFHDEESVIFTLILLGALLVLLTLGSTLAPLIVALIIAYLLQGMVNSLVRFNVPYLGAVVIVYTFFISTFMALLLLILPQAWTVILPPAFGFFILFIKDSALASQIGVVELTYVCLLYTSPSPRD